MAGRTGELSRIRERLATLKNGGLIVVEGVSGMGCSRLVAESIQQAHQLGVAVSTGQNQTPQQPAFSSLRDLFHDLTTDLDPPTAMAALFSNATRPDPERLDLWGLCAGFRELIEAGGPRLICIEDIDRADRGTCEVVEYLLRNLSETPVLFLLSRRPVTERDPLERLLRDERSWHIVLKSLSSSAVEQMLLYRIDADPRVRSAD